MPALLQGSELIPVVGTDPGLAQDGTQRADGDFTMLRHDGGAEPFGRGLAELYMAAFLPHLGKSGCEKPAPDLAVKLEA